MSPLPTIESRPDADVVIYDGKCGFCRSQVQRIARWDRGGRLAFLSLHDPVVAQRYGDLPPERLMQEMAIVDQAGRRHWGAEAFRYLTRRLPRLWPLAPLMHVPLSLPLWRFLYRQVAKRRYRLGKASGDADCDDDQACKIHLS